MSQSVSTYNILYLHVNIFIYLYILKVQIFTFKLISNSLQLNKYETKILTFRHNKHSPEKWGKIVIQVPWFVACEIGNKF